MKLSNKVVALKHVKASREPVSARAVATLDILKKQYFADARPWVVAFSGGKDSTLVLQLTYEMLKAIPREQQKPVYVVSSDTRVEAPNVADYVEKILAQIAEQARRDEVQLTTVLVRPKPAETFWAKLIGKGYPPPTRWFRWCTSNMKIKPSRRAIEEIARNYGSVILLLGTRIEESSDRRKRMQGQELNERRLNPHHEIPNALVMTPISDWNNDEVWEHLYSNSPPWGGNHTFMLELYRQANGGECPVVLDLNTPSCGGSRFGCWTCTVVKEDKSMRGFIESGEGRMIPLLEFRDWLKEIRELPEFRSTTRRDNSSGPGPFTPLARQQILDRLLSTERRVGFELVSEEELAFIQEQWSHDFDFSNEAARIAKSYGRKFAMDKTPNAVSEDDELLESIAAAHQLSPELAREVLNTAIRDFAELDAWGGKKNFQRDLATLIEKAVKLARQADPKNAL